MVSSFTGACEELLDDLIHPPESIGEWGIDPALVDRTDRWSPDCQGQLICVRGYGEGREELWLSGDSDDGWSVGHLTYDVPDDVDGLSGVALEPYEESDELSHHDNLDDAAASLVEEIKARSLPSAPRSE